MVKARSKLLAIADGVQPTLNLFHHQGQAATLVRNRKSGHERRNCANTLKKSPMLRKSRQSPARCVPDGKPPGFVWKRRAFPKRIRLDPEKVRVHTRF